MRTGNCILPPRHRQALDEGDTDTFHRVPRFPIRKVAPSEQESSVEKTEGETCNSSWTPGPKVGRALFTKWAPELQDENWADTHRGVGGESAPGTLPQPTRATVSCSGPLHKADLAPLGKKEIVSNSQAPLLSPDLTSDPLGSLPPTPTSGQTQGKYGN